MYKLYILYNTYVTGFAKRGPICQLWQLITSDWKELLPWYLGSGEHHYNWIHGEMFRLICYLNTELWSPTFTELDVCGRPLFANPVTYIDYRNLHGGFFVTEHSTRWLLLIALSTGWIVCSWTIYKVTSSSWSLYRVTSSSWTLYKVTCF